LTQRLVSILAPRDSDTNQYRNPWHILLAAQSWRTGERDEVLAQSEPVSNDWQGSIVFKDIQLCETASVTYIEAARPKEIQALLKFGRDSDWPLSEGNASVIEGETSLSITCGIDWTGCDGPVAWSWTKFFAAAATDQISVPPAFSRQEATSEMTLRKENNSLRTVIRENGADGSFPVTPEDSGTPVMILYGPMAIVKLRRHRPHEKQILDGLEACLQALYQGRMMVTEQLPTKEWAMVGSFDDDSGSGEIPAYHDLSTPPEAMAQSPAFNLRIHEAGLKAQNYDK
jgi:hypothetical protein